MRRAPGHPIAPPSGIVAVARLVLYDAIGPGPHKCHWCGASVVWNGQHGLFADHLNHDSTDDSLENLVPSCNACNAGRAKGAAFNKNLIGPGELFVVESTGRRSRALKRYCNICGVEFLAKMSEIRVGKGLYCSRSCARKGPRREKSSRNRVSQDGKQDG